MAAILLEKLRLQNFRCFADHEVEFQHNTLIVGKNNAGKSTCVEALRMVSLVTERMLNLPLRQPPREFALPARYKGYSPSLELIAVHKEGLFHRYEAPPAIITATFTNGSRMEVYMGDELRIHAVIFDPNGRISKSREGTVQAAIPRVSILPQIGPVAEEETLRGDPYVRSNLQTARCSLHFRNQLRILREHFPRFKELVSSTWHGLQISDLDVPPPYEKEKRINLLIRDGDFSAEIAWMGHGLQMWLQTMWFLSRNQDASVLILDEPDVYMHADLQRKLVRMLMQDHRQFIIATHSPEMLAEVEPESVVVLNRSKKVSKSATSSQAVQELLNHVGSVHNISLSRLATYGRILLVEGDDVPLLKLFQNALDPNAPIPIDAIPNSDVEGWSKWPSVITMAKFFRRNTPDQIAIFCVFDRDYHTDEEIEERRKEARMENIQLHVWEQKEIENYAVCPSAIARVISRDSGKVVFVDDVDELIKNKCEEMKDETVDIISEEIRLKKKQGTTKSNPLARQIVDARWKKAGGSAVVSGKDLFSTVAKWSQEQYGVSLSHRKVIREMRPSEVPHELVCFINQVTGQFEQK